MPVRQEDGPARLFVLGLGAHVIAIALLFGSVLSSSSEAENARPAPPPRAPAAPQESARASELVPAFPPADDAPARLELAALTTGEHEEARRATERLAMVLVGPAGEDELWAEAVALQARTLERAHEPALAALLADRTLSVEEHVAATELLDALRER